MRQTVTNLDRTQKPKNIDILALDMNGIFHPAAQMIFAYQAYAGSRAPYKATSAEDAGRMVAQQTLALIDDALRKINPSKQIWLFVDGVAGMAKQQQQRQRRYGSGTGETEEQLREVLKDRERGTYEHVYTYVQSDISPGTAFMRSLCGSLRAMIAARSDLLWRGKTVVWSSELSPGEGEHKILNMLRTVTGASSMTMCIHGLDADLIMLGSLHCWRVSEMYIFRDNRSHIQSIRVKIKAAQGRDRRSLASQLQGAAEYELVDVTAVSRKLSGLMGQSPVKDPNGFIRDFVFLAFLIGNDFLPHSPALSVYDRGLDLLIDAYKRIKAGSRGKLITQEDGHGGVFINLPLLGKFLALSAKTEGSQLLLLSQKIKRGENHAWPMLGTATRERSADTEEWLAHFKKDYYAAYFNNAGMTEICQEYILGCQWVLEYYMTGIPSWKWRYPFLRAPFAAELANMIANNEYKETSFPWSQPATPAEQIAYVFPPSLSVKILPVTYAAYVLQNQRWFPLHAKKNLEGISVDREFLAHLELPSIDISTTEKELSALKVPPSALASNTHRQYSEMFEAGKISFLTV